ncbi:MAG: tetratricopeptide repeat protein [Methanomicrobiaceae archaeon]|nr:tetratricopeptide repeat protein [Methanomicrobiaceae archaeon]
MRLAFFSLVLLIAALVCCGCMGAQGETHPAHLPAPDANGSGQVPFLDGRQQVAVSFAIREEGDETQNAEAREWFFRGLAFNAQNGCSEEALACFDRATALDPGYAEAWFAKGVGLFNLGRYDASLAALDMALDIDPGMAAAWHLKGMVVGTMDRHEEAHACFLNASALVPGYPPGA